jgi:hypothetical protein
MTTPDEFLERVLAAVDDAAFRLAGTPKERREEWLSGFARRVRKQWRSLFMPALSAEDVDSMVNDVVERVRAKRDEIEAAGVGRA